MLPGEALVGGVGPVRVGEPAVGLEQPVVPVVEPPLRPAPDDLRTVELLERDPLGGQARDVVGERDRASRGATSRPPVRITTRTPASASSSAHVA